MNRKTFTEVAKLWQEEKALYVKKTTMAAYSFQIDNHLIPAFGARTNIEEKLVQEYVLEKLKEGISPKTLKDRIMILKMILKYGAKHKYMVYNEIEIKYPIKQTKNIEILSREDQKKILSYARLTPSPKNLGLILCLCSGMRIGELCALQWEDLDTKAELIHITKTIQRIYLSEKRKTEIVLDSPKTASSIRDIPMTKEELKITKTYKKISEPKNYVLSDTRTPIEPRTFRGYLNKVLNELNIPKVKFHALRHSFATRCIESGCDYKTVSSLLGHSNISITLNLYVHPNTDQKRKCINKMLHDLK